MTRTTPLPDSLLDRPFTVGEARAAGVNRGRLRRSDLESPTHGARVARVARVAPPADETPSERRARLREELVLRVQHLAPALTVDQFFSHDTALALLGAPLPYGSGAALPIHVSAHRPAGQPRRREVVGHRLQARPVAEWIAAGVRVEHPVRAWRQVAVTWGLDDLIAAADHLVSPRVRFATVDDLRAEVAMLGDLPGGILQRALAEVRVGAETAEETAVRLLITRAGLPEPELNWTLHTREGRFVARLDLAYPAYRVAIEHDGRVHAFDERQFARDADRWDDVRAQGWTHVRILSHHLRPDPAVALDRIVTALLSHGWRPPRR
ncbi:hypothetical protein [Microbacterium telephonicum]|uniref:hypothetical protein n=1 Tax=Microbacterium telephonicum TaxID=1714841 RepID=UPI000EAD9C6B|nr:hypothetical protein [Microbacterium telephonicum]